MKKLLALLVAFALVFSMVALVACNNCEHEFKDGKCTKCGEPDPDYKAPEGPNNDPGNDPGKDVEVPVEEGKLTLYFTLADGSVEIPSYASVFFAGGQTGFATGLAAPEFKNVAGTKVYYVQIVYDATIASQANDYQLVLGYNKSSELPDDKCGLIWNDAYKSDECAAVKYPDNPTFTYTEGAQKISLGVHTFSTAVSAPETVDELEFRITFTEALGAKAEVYILGGFNNWGNDDLNDAKATVSATDSKVWSITLQKVLCTNYSYKIVIYKDGMGADGLVTEKQKVDEDGKPVVDAEGKPEMEALGVWGQYVENPTWTGHKETDKLMGYTVISAGSENLPISVVGADGIIGYVDLAGTISETNATLQTTQQGIDLSTAALLEGKTEDKDGKEIGNGEFTYTVALIGNKTLKVEFDKALDANVDVYIIGAFRSWGVSVEDAKMAVSEDRLSATVTYEILPDDYEYNIIFVHKEVELKEVQSIWDFGSKLQDANCKVTISGLEDGEVKLFAKAVTVPTVNPPKRLESVVLEVTFDSAVDANAHVLIAGDFEGWHGTEMTANTDRTVFTLTLTNVIVKTYQCKVCISENTNMVWNTAWGKDAAVGVDANQPFEVKEDSVKVALFGDETVLEVPKVEKIASVTVTVAFEEGLTGKTVYFAGDLTGWGDAPIKMTANADGTVFTATFTNVNTGPSGFKIIVMDGEDAAFAWSGKELSNGGGNVSLVLAVADNGQTIEFVGDMANSSVALKTAE